MIPTQRRIVRGYASLHDPDQHPYANNPKLTESVVKEIRARYKPKRTTYAQLSREYGVALTTIKRIVTRKTWRHI